MIDPGYVSVDVETSGPTPAGYSLLSIGACLVADPGREFYVELQPIPGLRALPEALEVSEQTVKNHISSILRKLDAKDRTEAAVYALRHGWIRLADAKPEE